MLHVTPKESVMHLQKLMNRLTISQFDNCTVRTRAQCNKKHKKYRLRWQAVCSPPLSVLRVQSNTKWTSQHLIRTTTINRGDVLMVLSTQPSEVKVGILCAKRELQHFLCQEQEQSWWKMWLIKCLVVSTEDRTGSWDKKSDKSRCVFGSGLQGFWPWFLFIPPIQMDYSLGESAQ